MKNEVENFFEILGEKIGEHSEAYRNDRDQHTFNYLSTLKELAYAFADAAKETGAFEDNDNASPSKKET